MQTRMKTTELKFYMTNSIRQLEVLADKIKYDKKCNEIYSEIIYWIASLELVRNYFIKDCSHEYIGINDSLDELLDEMSSSLLIVNHILNKEQMKDLLTAIEFCKKSKEILQ